jgi:hypothetical protein
MSDLSWSLFAASHQSGPQIRRITVQDYRESRVTCDLTTPDCGRIGQKRFIFEILHMGRGHRCRGSNAAVLEGGD